MGTPRHRTAALAALLTIGLLGGCTDDSPDKDSTGSSTKDGSQTTVEMTEVKGTQALRPRTRVVGDWEAVVSGKRSTVVAGITGSDGKPTQLFAVDPTSRQQRPLDVSAPIGWDESSNAKTAVVAGDVSQDNAREPFVRLSSDLKTWEDVPISYPAKGWAFSDVGLDGDVPLVIAEKPDGSTALMRRDGADWTTHDLPAAKGQEISPIDLVEHKGQLVLLVREAKRGDQPVTRVLSSDDGGKTWERGTRMAGAKGSYGIAGLVSTGKTLVATGWADRTSPLGTSGMVWTSQDGKLWKRQRTTPISWREEDAFNVTEDFYLSAPEAIDARAAFDQTCGSCTWTTRFVHPGTGAAQVQDNQVSIRAVGPASQALPGDPGAGVRKVEGSLITYDGKSSRPLVEAETPRGVSGIEEVGATRQVAVGQFGFTGDPDGGWSTTTQLTPFVLDGSLRRQDWKPKVLSTWSGVETATNGTGMTVAAGTLGGDGFRADAGSLVGGSWKKASGLGRAGFEDVQGLTYEGGSFLMSLVVAADGKDGTTRSARIYSSKDGVTWSEDSGTWAPTDQSGSRISKVCTLGDDTPFAVGSSQADANARYAATTWTRSEGAWDLDVPTLKGAGASFDSCATTGDTTVVSGSVDGVDIEWTTKDGKAFTVRAPLPRGVSRGTPHEVTGGLVADGYLDTADHTGPVVWFSKDGKTWQWAPVDVDDATASVLILSAGEDVYAVTSQASGDRIWTIDEIATTKVSGDEG